MIKKIIYKIYNIILGTYYNIANKHNDLAIKRLCICKQCPSRITITKNLHICKECGCVLESKTRVKTEQCLDDKW